MLREQKNSRKQGDVGLGSAIAYFTSQGWTVCIPLTDSQRYDLVVEIDGELKRVQVKTSFCTAPSGAYTVELRTKGNNNTGNNVNVKRFTSKDADSLFVLVDSGKKYFIPTSKIENKASICVGKESYKEFEI